jgi:putative addiction module CopG family antidote
MATLSITLPKKMMAYVEQQMAEGNYDDVSDFICEILRQEQKRKAVIDEINAALKDGDTSGYLPFAREEFEAHLEQLVKKNAA